MTATNRDEDDPGNRSDVSAAEDTADVVPTGAAAGGVGAGVTPTVGPRLTFPQAPQTQLEELISELPARARDVLNVQGRLQSLLRANALVVDDLRLPVVLRHVVTAACGLVQARSGALGIINADGDLEQTVHAGIDSPDGSRTGDSGAGVSVSGLPVDFPMPVRLSNLNAAPAAVESPAGEAAKANFLGVPIRVRGKIYGYLYLAGSDADTQFSAEDEQLVTALAATAGAAVGNALLYEETVQQRTWLTASTELAQTLFAGTTEEPLRLLLGFAMRGASADMAAFTVPISGTEARVQAAAGTLAGTVGSVVDLDRTFVGRVLRSGTPLLIGGDDITGFDTGGSDDATVSVAGVIGVPLLGAVSGVLGVLTVARFPGSAVFTMNDRDQLAGFLNHAGIALQLETVRGEHESLLRIQDHERIAADLHDHAIQELFAVGMGLQGMLGGIHRPDQRARINGYIDALDSTIQRIRSTIFQIQIEPAAHRTLTMQVLAILKEQITDLGIATEVEFAGPLDLGMPPALIDDIMAVTREALLNTARHSRASLVHLGMRLAGDVLTIDITDNGTGTGDPPDAGGQAHLRRRAETHRGTLTVDLPPGGGTHLRWTANLR